MSYSFPQRSSLLLMVLFPIGVWAFAVAAECQAEDRVVSSFSRHIATDVYYSEGVATGDINGDGKVDVVHGPYWFEGPTFKVGHEIYPAKAQPRERYADNFFSWVYDFDGDGHNDVLTAGFPGTPAYVYQNPGPAGLKSTWTKHEVFDWVSNEAPQFTNIIGDDRPELVCTRDGHFGYVTVNWKDPFSKWMFHAISPSVTAKRFGHGLGIGDIDGDGRLDMLMKGGWYAQPEDLAGDPAWKLHEFSFAAAGGAEMYAYDVDGDGDQDVITSLAAHDYGLAWYEQIGNGSPVNFRKHIIVGNKPEENRYGLLFTEMHSVHLVDIDGDGLKDIVTGKTFWSHHRQSPLWDAGAVVYWFRLERTDAGVDWVPNLADADAGIGRQIVVSDINQDDIPDIIVGGMKGCSILTQSRERVSDQRWRAAQPKPLRELKSGLAPDEAAGYMTVPAGFQVQLAAGEPDVHQPVAMTIDERGRVWVAEAYTYPIRAAEGEGRDRIIILEDTNADGRLDQRKIFAEGLNLVSGLEVGFGGAWVGAAPYLLFIPDADGDDRADGEPRVLLDGFAYADTHETLNAFNWGPDGWLYGCQGVFTHSRIGVPGTPDDERTPMNAAVWRYHPTRHEFEVFAWGSSNPWGVDFDDHGQAFITACVIPHLYHVIQGGRYQRQAGRHFGEYVYDDIKTIADHAHYVGNIRDHAWWGHEPDAPGDTLQAGGGHAHCGAMIYLADNWPASYRNRIFMNNVHGNRVNMDILERHGSGYVGHHGDDLLLANDRWFRGINLRTAPDGSVYLIDWYDRNACHRANPEIWDRSNGRIYNISYGVPERKKVDLGVMSDRDLVSLHEAPNDWYVRTARRLLQHRMSQRSLDQAAVEQLHRLLLSDDDTRVLRAAWTLHATVGLRPKVIHGMLSHSSPYVQAWAVQLTLEDSEVEEETFLRFLDLANGSADPIVRLYLAAALQRLASAQVFELATALAQHGEDKEDHNLPLMVWYGVEPHVVDHAAAAMQLATTSQIPILTRYIIRRAAVAPAALDGVLTQLALIKESAKQVAVLDEILNAFEGRVDVVMPKSWERLYALLADSDNDVVRQRAVQVAVVFGDSRVYPQLRELMISDSVSIEKRQAAMQTLLRGRDPELAPHLLQLLGTPKLRSLAIRALAAYAHPQTAEWLIRGYQQFDSQSRQDAVTTLVARPEYARQLMRAIRDDLLPRRDIHAYHVRQLARLKDDELQQLIKEVWGEIRESSVEKKALIATHKARLTPEELRQASLGHGRMIFAKSCSSCHTLFAVGGKIGPDLTGSNRANLDYLLENILDPSAVLGKDYRMTVVSTTSGRILSGIVTAENVTAITLTTINDSVVVPQSDIEDRTLSNLSLMPEGLLKELTDDEVRDLVAYMASPSQVAPRGPSAPIDPKTKRVSGAQEGESLKLVEKSAGSAKSQGMGGFPLDRWSGEDHLWWTGAKPGDRLALATTTEAAAKYDVEIVLTRARDYGVVQLHLAGKKLADPIDLYSADVVTTGVLTFRSIPLPKGEIQLVVEIVGANPKAVKAYMFGLDYIRLIRQSE
ncbi:MAG: PVC-type heme-binding CxxCH protein [Pirellulaceae bacterium]